MELSTQLACAFLKKAYIIKKKHPMMFIIRYSSDWLPIMFRLLRLKAVRENSAPTHPMPSFANFLAANIGLHFSLSKISVRASL